ncbi:MAG TPA: histidine--tRNA ligase [Chitinophagaceae bacterium]|nr:histidine--tRNA ligase [Chitinophagaceae bacterium]
MAKPTLPQGTRDFNAEVVRKRNFIFDTIRNVFELYGFQPLETPAIENLETLMGKYGEEGDKLIFKILNNGLDNLSRHNGAREDFEKILKGKNAKSITERALRYDLTIPFARYIAMNHNQLSFPFKRYQIQPVWRADRPQKGRYREFYQCDADIAGNYSLLNEVELTNIYAEVFNRLNIDIEIRINNRKILTALAEICESTDKMTDITIAIDKLERIGIDGVKKELQRRNLNEEQINIIDRYLNVTGSNEEKLQQIKSLLGKNETGKKGIEELEFILNFINLQSAIYNLQLDFTLARGLNYYTGIIYEIKAKDVQMGSIGGGGRYDDLTGLFGVPGLPGIGISFGVDRIYDVMEELKLFPENVHTGTQVLFFNLGAEESKAAYGLMQQVRAAGIKCEIYHEPAKFDKQFKYAEKKNIPFAVIIGTKEMHERTGVVKDLKKGEQKTIQQDELINFFK